jgi:hypothetical protein
MHEVKQEYKLVYTVGFHLCNQHLIYRLIINILIAVLSASSHRPYVTEYTINANLILY